MRASLRRGLAMGYRLWGARLGVAIDDVEVEMTCEYDARGQLGVADDVAVGWQQRALRRDDHQRRARGRDVRRVVEPADRLNPMLANLAPAVRAACHHLRSILASAHA